MPAHNMLFSKSTKEAARRNIFIRRTGFNILIRRTNRYQQYYYYYMPSQHMYCGRVWNLIQACGLQSSD